ncbi:MAG: hypothetical protein RIR62_2539 [Pseudomonadota bacterium]
MADVDFDDFDAGYGAPMAAQMRLGRLVTLGGAVASVGLVIGLGYWGYSVAVRDVQGVPVIRAMEGPMRIAPENPGGEIADHQGLSVNAVAAVGVAAPPPERLLLAPRPMELTDEDMAGLAAASVPEAATAVAPAPGGTAPAAPAAPAPLMAALQGATPVAAPPPVAASAPVTASDPQQGAVELALAEALSDAAAPAAGAATLAALEGDNGGTSRPRARPEDAAPGALTTTLAPADAPALTVTELDPATLAAGTRLVQLGAFDTPEEARAEWTRLLNANADLLAGKSLVVQAAASGGRAFFRLRAAGFATEGEARDLCSALLGRDSTCIPVLHR